MKEFSAQSGATLADEPDTAGEQFANLPLHLLVSSLTNPRKNFDPVKLTELADSIKASGVHQPILVRPLPGSRVQETSREAHRGQKHQGYVVPTHEIVSGERRYRASTLAGVATIPALIRPLSDDQVLEIQIVENLQRDDLTALEEADGYERLLLTGRSAAEIAQKIGKSSRYVYARIQLQHLFPEARTALCEGRIDASRALLIARVPDGKLQLKALEFATEIDSYDNTPPSLRELQTWLQQNVMLRLDRAPFKITDARLLEAAGSCKDCPKRTGANPDLFADVDGADICTDPPCYNKKSDAHRATLIARAEAKGMDVIDGAAAKKICSQQGGMLKGYSPLSQVRDDINGERLDALLGKDAPAPVLIENPWTKELIEAVPTDEAEALLLAKGLIKATGAARDQQGQLDAAIERIKSNLAARTVNESRAAIFRALAAAIHATPDTQATGLITTELIRHWLFEQVRHREEEDLAAALDMQEDATEAQLHSAIQTTRTGGLWKALAVLMVADDRHPPWQFRKGGGRADLFEAVAKSTKTDIAAISAETAARIKAEAAEEIKKLKAEAKTAAAPKTKKPPPPTTPLAQAPALPTAAAQPKKPAKPAPPRTPRLSAQEAQSGIAEAMQGIEVEPVPGPAPVALAIGQRVRVTPDLNKLRPIVSRFAGKVGAIISAGDETAWQVDLGRQGRNGGVREFLPEEIEVVA